MIYTYADQGLLDILDCKTNRSEIRNKLPLTYVEFKKSPFSSNTSDMFGNSEILIIYDDKDILSGIEIYEEEAEFYFLGKQILGMKLIDVKEMLTENKLEFYFEDSGLILKKYKIELFLPDIEEEQDESIVKSVYLKSI